MKRSGPLKRKTRLKSTSQLARGGGLKRTTRVKATNPKRLAKRRAEAFGPQAELCRTLPCLICNRAAPSDPDHVRSRGASGKDRANVVPLCRDCHMRRHGKGIRWMEEHYSVNFKEAAEELALEAYPDDEA